MNLQEMGRLAKEASINLLQAPPAQKVHALILIATELENASSAILEANRLDIEEAKSQELDEAMVDRLSLQDRLGSIIEDVKLVASFPDPIDEIFDKRTLDNGLKLYRKRTPIGVLGVIYEARPNVTIDIISVAIKTGNAVILRGGSETLRTNLAIVEAVHRALQHADLPLHAVQLIDSPDRELVKEFLSLHEYIDLIIPRGGEALHAFCRAHSHIPVITGGAGVCHLFVDQNADEQKSLEVILNAKVQRPTVCNALDTVLIHQDYAKKFVPMLISLLQNFEVDFKGDPAVMEIMAGQEVKTSLEPAQDSDWDTEWLGLTLGIKVVENLTGALEHIRCHSTGHSDGILTGSKKQADRFVEEVDSAAVYVNASTRFTDAGQFGLGSEVAISTQKLHARGPMGLRELTSYKWVIKGDYHVRP